MKSLKERLTVHHWVGLLGIVLLISWFAFNFNHGERIQFNGGLGWDGAAYADWAQRDSWAILNSHTVSEYYIGRLLPSFFIHHVSKFVGYDISNTPRVIHAFYIFNVGLLLTGAALIALIGRHYRWSLKIYFLAGAAIYLNYPVLTNLSYNPTLTDMCGYILGLGIFYGYISGRFWLLVLLTVLCAFVWPTMLYGALPLIMLGRTKVALAPVRWHGHLFAILAAIALLSLAAYLYFYRGLRQTDGTTTFVITVLPLSVILFALYIYFALRRLIDIPACFWAFLKIKPLAVICGIVIFFAVKYVVHHFSDHTPGPLTITTYLGLFTQASLSNPLINLVAHAMHYGPFYLVTIFLWPRVVDCAKEQGLGLVAFVTLFAFLSIGSESRQFLNAWPAFAMLTCQVLSKMDEEGRVDWWFTYSIALIGLVLSRFWLTINVGPWTGNFQQFPDQMLYMYSGPWISHQMYGVFLSVTILTSVALLSLLRNGPVSLPARALVE